MGGSEMTGGSIDNYLKYNAQSAGNKYPRISVSTDSGSNIEYVELRKDGDVIHVSGRDVSLSNLLDEVGICGFKYASELFYEILKGKQLKFKVGSEGACIGEVVLDNDHILEIGKLESRLQFIGQLVRA